MSNETYIDMTHMDWALLREQKLALVEVLNGKPCQMPITENLEGILHTLDAIQDQASEQLGADAVFGPEKKEG